MKKNIARFEKRLAKCDISLFDFAKASLTNGDKKSFLAIQNALRSRPSSYVYLEIGSYLGGSLQTILLDSHCRRIYSIDSRILRQIDVRGEIDYYPNNTTATMLKTLRRFSGGHMSKLVTFDMETKGVNPKDIKERPDICFIDGDHTDRVVFNDFLFCMSVGSRQVLILFHDVQMIFAGLRRCIDYLRKKNISYQSFMLPSSIGVIALRHHILPEDTVLAERMTHSMDGVLYCLESLAVFRDYYKVTNKNVFISTLVRLLGQIKVRSAKKL